MKILLIILAVFIVIGFIKLRFNISYYDKEGLEVVLRIVFFKFILYSANRQKKKGEFSNKKVKNGKKIKKDKKKEKSHDKKKNKKNILSILKLVEIFLKPIPKFLAFLNRGFKITNFKCNIVCSGGDAQKTALLYANISKIVYIVLGVVSSYCCVVKKNVNIYMDFLNEKTKFNLLLKMKIGIGRIIIGIFLYLYFVFVGFVFRNFLKK